jgi:two-component system, sensor histidine kinase PdtaS
MTVVVPAMGQEVSGRSQTELRLLLQQSKQDSNRIVILHALGKTYLIQEYGDKKESVMDSAIDIFNYAIRLSDTLQLEDLKYESTLLTGRAYLMKADSEEGKKRFYEVAAIYHAKGDFNKEAGTWLQLARSLNWYTGKFTEINASFYKAIALFKQVHNIDKAAESQASLSDYIFHLGKYSLAETEAIQSLNLFNQIKSAKAAQVYFLLSEINRYRGSYEKSLLYATKGAESAERNQATTHVDAMFGELALVYDELGRVEESSQWYRRTLNKRIEQKEDRAIIFRTANFLVRQLVKLKKSKQALALMDSLVVVEPPRGEFEKAIVAQNYAYCFEGVKQYPEAEKYFLAMAAHYRKAPPNGEILSIANMDLGRFYLQRRQFKKAHSYLDTALAYRSDDRLLDKRELYQMLFTADSALGNNGAAIKELQQYQFINDSIYNERKSRQIEELTIQYETVKKEQSIRLLEKEKALQKNELAKEQNTKRWIVGATLLLIVMIGLLVNYSRLKQRTNQELQVQQLQIEKKNNSLQDLVAEKEWLVREIHHRVKNNFHMVMGLLRTQAAYLQSEEAIQAVTESSQRIQAMSLVHQKLYQSENLSAINMVDYIHELTDYLKDSFHTGHTIRFNLQIDPVTFTVSHCVPVGLIVNEAVTNAIKHAFPDKQEGVIDISLKAMAGNHFSLFIKDNGIGLPEAFDPVNRSSMGMKLMRGLSDDLDAAFQVNSNMGTQITLNFTTEA